MELTKAQKSLIKMAEELSYLEWLRTSHAIQQAFEEKERSARKELKVDAERIFYFAENP